ncbi:tetratricopeptide repeat protein [Herbaspirillum sp. NPDC087042]|uniref:tetratricopeptide repeat protein n=1 Tax=Herbaspirillum sp. NPDC087042 TaxID=3364004 RepID=UPI003813DE0C
MTISDPAILARLMGLMCEAIALRGAGQPDAALAALDQALALDEQFLPVQMQRADLFEQEGRWEAAVAAYEACLDIAPDFDDARRAHRLALASLADHCRRQLDDVGPGSQQQADIAHTLALTLFKLDQPEQALAPADLALSLAPTALAAQALRADILLRLNRHEEALDCYPAVEPADGDAAALHAFNRGDILWRMGQVEAAQASFERALQLQPDFAQARVGRAHLLLMQGEFGQGWVEHESRFQIADLARRSIQADSPPWRPGDALQGKHVLLWAEQGQGDTLQFARYIAVVVQHAARVTLCAPAALLPLLAQSFPTIHGVTTAAQAGPHDLHASLMSLPWLLDLPDPGQGPQPPYLRTDASRVQAWRAQLDAMLPARRPRIGIAWAGRQYATIHHSRDLPLAELAPLLDLPADFVSLQKEIPASDLASHAALGQRLHAVELADWADTAALICALDLVISVDTAVVHLAGALGGPAWLPLRLEGEWRWGRQDSRSDWYRSLQLFRQPVRGQWAPVVQAMAAACRARFTQM